jgi:hypothetical protein
LGIVPDSIWIVFENAVNIPRCRKSLSFSSAVHTGNYYINTKPALRAAANARKVRLEDGEPKVAKLIEQMPAELRNSGTG